MTLPAFMSNTGASRDGDSPVQKEILGMNCKGNCLALAGGLNITGARVYTTCLSKRPDIQEAFPLYPQDVHLLRLFKTIRLRVHIWQKCGAQHAIHHASISRARDGALGRLA